ncbi:MAG: pilus assembly protein, partial [Nitrospinota bacterium]
NFLNWVSMRRIDIAKKVLVGGKTVGRSPEPDPYALIGEVPPNNGACCREFKKQYNGTGMTPFSGDYYYGVYEDGMIYVDDDDSPFSGWHGRYNIRVEIGSSEPIGLIQKMDDKVRFGLEVFNIRQGGGIVNYIKSGNTGAIVTNIEDLDPETWTPLAEAFYEGVRYFMQVDPYYLSTDYSVTGNGNDPYYFTTAEETLSCAKGFVIMITDGESTKDLDIPDNLKDYDGDGNDPGSYSSDGSDYLDDVALWAHTTDMRPAGAKEIAGEQNITLYTIFAFGTGSQLLQDAAKNGGFIDDNDNDIPDLQIEWDADGDNIPDTYSAAEEGDDLEVAILNAINSILQQTMTSTSLSVVTTAGEGEGSVFQAYFLPSKEGVDWLGYLQALWIDSYGNLREDSDGDMQLDTDNNDDIVKFVFDPLENKTKINRYHVQGNGLPEDAPYETGVDLDDLKSLWEAGKMLADRDISADPRNIYTFVDSNEDHACNVSKTPCAPGEGDFKYFTEGNASTLKPYLRADDTGLYTAGNIIKFIRGESEDVTGLRKRKIDNGTVWRLGDIVYSTPTVVGRPMEKYHLRYRDDTYREFYKRYNDNRETIVYVGANDGMLHAFTAGFYDKENKKYKVADGTDNTPYGSAAEPGTEIWAYIPYNLLPHLKWLTGEDYTHVYYVDMKPKITDAQIFECDTGANPVYVGKNGTTGKCWGTILIGGMRLGGGELTINDFNGSGSPKTFRSAYFALDITNTANPPRLLWEFTAPDLGFTASYPSIAKVNDNWFVIIGSGPTDYDVNSDQNARIFVLDLDTGSLRKEFDFTDGNAFMGSTITVDINNSYTTEAGYMGMTYNTGTKAAPEWKGKMLRVAMEGKDDPVSWKSSEFYNTAVGTKEQPVTAAPSAAIALPPGCLQPSCLKYDLWVYFGTGRYYNDPDKLDTEGQSFYGIKEKCWNNVSLKWTDGCTDIANNLYDSTNVVVSVGGDLGGTGGGSATLDDLNTNIKTNYDGWYIDLPGSGTSEPAERSLNKPSILAGMVFFNTFTPDSNPCNFGGTGKLYATFFTTGTAWKEDIIGLNGSIVLRSTDLGDGASSGISMHLGDEEGATAYIQTTTGKIIKIDLPVLPFSVQSGLLYWMENR